MNHRWTQILTNNRREKEDPEGQACGAGAKRGMRKKITTELTREHREKIKAKNKKRKLTTEARKLGNAEK